MSDYYSRAIWDIPQLLDRQVIADVLMLVYALEGAAPTTGPDGVRIPGFAGLTSNRTVAMSQIATGTYTGVEFVKGDGTLQAPTAVAARTWGYSATDNALKATNGDPAAANGTAQTFPATATCYALRIWLPAQTYTGYWVNCNAIPSGTINANTFFMGLSNTDATGTFVTGTQTADASGLWSSTGNHSIAMTTPFTVTTPAYYYVLLQAGTYASGTGAKVATFATYAPASLGLNTGASAPNLAVAPRFGIATNQWSGTTPPATTGNITSANAFTILVGLY
jgi:hypothetical protein